MAESQYEDRRFHLLWFYTLVHGVEKIAKDFVVNYEYVPGDDVEFLLPAAWTIEMFPPEYFDLRQASLLDINGTLLAPVGTLLEGHPSVVITTAPYVDVNYVTRDTSESRVTGRKEYSTV